MSSLRGTVYVKESKVWGKDKERNTQNTQETEDETLSEYYIDASLREQPYRAVRLLRNLAVGHAFSQGRDTYNMSDIPVVIKT